MFADPLAVRIVGVNSSELTDRDTAASDTGDPVANLRRRLLIAARHRYAEDNVASAVSAGTRQVVILGARSGSATPRNKIYETRSARGRACWSSRKRVRLNRTAGAGGRFGLAW